ncbi:MAG: YdcF family protein [Pseudomonadota bacterium]
MGLTRVRLSSIGGNGIKMLLLTLLLTGASGGLSLLGACYHVWRVAVRTGTDSGGRRQLLVLGMQLDEKGACRPDYRRRLGRACQLLERGEVEALYLLGGVTSAGAPSEASAGRDYLYAQGCRPPRLHLEEGSRHTLENLQQVRSLLGEDIDCAIVTSRYHLARTTAMARGMGLRHRLCAAEDRFVLSGGNLPRLLSEGFMLQWYYTGRYWARWVGDHESLRRIS